MDHALARDFLEFHVATAIGPVGAELARATSQLSATNSFGQEINLSFAPIHYWTDRPDEQLAAPTLRRTYDGSQ
jgi:hypothetical protein